MVYGYKFDIPKEFLILLNNLYEVEKKLTMHSDSGYINRNIEKMKDALAELGFFYEDPMGQTYKETRTDLDASISGSSTECLIVVEVIKPIVRYGDANFTRVVQKGIVVVESKEGKM